MHADSKSSLPDPIPLPEGIKLRARKFGSAPTSQFVPALVGDDTCSRPAFILRHEDPPQGLSVTVRAQPDGRLIAEVFCADAALLHKAVFVGLAGKIEGQPIGKPISLDVPADRGCRGSAELGSLTDAVKQLGHELAIVMFLLV